ncbi:hypothetical protein [Lacrimispora sp.]|uniref:hypothetical protein n=1 Tax=Lacrimispora sp. TaxID=2719234 RepID=UPI00399332E4
MKIDRKKLLKKHNPVLTEVDVETPLTVGNGELAFTADITGMQTFYETYNTVPLCTMSQWGWHTKPVSEERYGYTLSDMVMTEYGRKGRTISYPKRRQPGNEEVYDWLRENPHRLNLSRIGLTLGKEEITSSMIHSIRQELHLYEGILESSFAIGKDACKVETACDNAGNQVLAFRLTGQALRNKNLEVKIDFPYGSPHISGSDWESKDRHETKSLKAEKGRLILKRTLDRDIYYVGIATNGTVEQNLEEHRLYIIPKEEVLEITVSFLNSPPEVFFHAEHVFENSRDGWNHFWEDGGIIRLNKSKDRRAFELERRILLSQYLMAVNSSGSSPPQETGLTCNSWYGKMHLEMYLWHCAWLPLWNHGKLLDRSLKWYTDHLEEARDNAKRNGFKGARWPKMIAAEGIDAPSEVAPLLVWQQPHIIYMLELAYRERPEQALLERYWKLIKETADFMVDFVVWNPEKGCYDICAPVIPVQECHKETKTHNPAFEIEYWQLALKIAVEWSKRLQKTPDPKWSDVGEHMAGLTEMDGVYLAHERCPSTFTEFNRDHPSMLGAYGLIPGTRIDRKVMERTLHRVLECWNYQTLWGWDFAMMAMTAVRLGKPELAIEILLKDTPKNCYLKNGNNMQITRKDLPLYLPGNGSLLLAAALMTAGYDGCERKTPGFPDNGAWTVEYEGINPLL